VYPRSLGCQLTITDPPTKAFTLGITVSGTGSLCNDVVTPDSAPTDWYENKLTSLYLYLNGTAYAIASNSATSLTLAYPPCDFPWSIDFSHDGSGTLVGGVFTPDVAPDGWTGNLAGMTLQLRQAPDSFHNYTVSSNTTTSATIGSPPADGTYLWSIPVIVSSSLSLLCGKTATPYGTTLSWQTGWFTGASVTINGSTYAIAANDATTFTVVSGSPIHVPYSWELRWYNQITTSGQARIADATLTPVPAPDGWVFDMSGIHCVVETVEYAIVSNVQNTSITLNDSPAMDYAWEIDCDWEVIGGDWVGHGTSATTSSTGAKILWKTLLSVYQYSIQTTGAAGVAPTEISGTSSLTLTLGTGHGFTTAKLVDLTWHGYDASVCYCFGMTVTATDDTTITVDNTTGDGTRFPLGYISIPATVMVNDDREATIYFGPDGAYSFSGRTVTGVCVFFQDDQYIVEGYSEETYATARYFQQKVDKTTWEASPHRIGVGGDGPLSFSEISVYETKDIAEEYPPPTNCADCTKSCAGCLRDEPPDCWEAWLTGLAEINPESGKHCACANDTHVFLPSTPGTSYWSGGRYYCYGWTFPPNLPYYTTIGTYYGDVVGYAVGIAKKWTSKYWSLEITVSGTGSFCDNTFIPASAPTDWIEHKLIGRTLTVNGQAYSITENTTTTATLSMSALPWSLTITISGSGATLQDGVVTPSIAPTGWGVGQLAGTQVTVGGVLCEVTNNTITSIATTADPSLAWSVAFTKNGTGATLTSGVLSPSPAPINWKTGNLVGHTVTIGGLPYTVTANDTTTLTISDPPENGSYLWALDIVTTSGTGKFFNKVLTPFPAPTDWLGGDFAGCSATIDGTAFTIASNTDIAFTTSENLPHGSYSWSLAMPNGVTRY
jgi:hypothetical protein